jgi:hypothetical protein
MFLTNKYLRWYQQLCSKNYTGSGVHRHHIVPRSLGGTDDSSNLVNLSYRQHFVAHRLLLKITRGKDRSKMAFAMMRFGKTSRSYEAVSRQISEALSGAGNPMFGRTLTEEHRASISGENHGMFGRCAYDLWVEKHGVDVADLLKDRTRIKRSASLSDAGNGMYGKKHTAERNVAHSQSLTGRKYMWKDGKQKRIRPENIEAMLLGGWTLTRPDQSSLS